MAMESIRVSGIVPATPERVYQAWLNSREHGAMTGGVAKVEPTIGGSFSAWDGYITGRTIELELDRRIVQTWRTTEFPADAPDSRLEVILEPAQEGARVTFEHSDIPEGQASRYEDGWKTYYLEPMVRYFEAASRVTRPMDLSPLLGRRAGAEKSAPAKKKPAAKKRAAARKAVERKAATARRPAAAKKTAAKKAATAKKPAAAKKTAAKKAATAKKPVAAKKTAAGKKAAKKKAATATKPGAAKKAAVKKRGTAKTATRRTTRSRRR